MAVLRRTRFSVATLFAGALFGPVAPSATVAAVPVPANTQAVYAAFTINLTRFITWPEGTFATPDAPLIVGTFPRDPINDALDRAAQGETVDGHPIRTMRIESLDDLEKCHVVYLARAYATRPAVLRRLVHRPVLTVSDAAGFLELGGHVRFEQRALHVVPRVSAENLKNSGLEGRAQLLRLAATP
jgi:hypothetical protein